MLLFNEASKPDLFELLAAMDIIPCFALVPGTFRYLRGSPYILSDPSFQPTALAARAVPDHYIGNVVLVRIPMIDRTDHRWKLLARVHILLVLLLALLLLTHLPLLGSSHALCSSGSRIGAGIRCMGTSSRDGC